MTLQVQFLVPGKHFLNSRFCRSLGTFDLLYVLIGPRTVERRGNNLSDSEVTTTALSSLNKSGGKTN